MREQIGRHHRYGQASLVQWRGEALQSDLPGTLVGGVAGGEAEQVIVVERDPRGAELGEGVDGFHRVEYRTGGVPEEVLASPTDGPETEAGVVVLGGDVAVVIRTYLLIWGLFEACRRATVPGGPVTFVGGQNVAGTG